MAFLVHPLPPHPVYVKKEYLYDHQKGHGELTLVSGFQLRVFKQKHYILKHFLLNMVPYMINYL